MFAAPEELEFRSRRSPIVCLNGCVATSQPLASEVGLRVLRSGGNAADAAVAACAALNVTEPCQCGIGGDAFCVYYDAKTKTVKGLNGSGRSPAALTRAIAEARGGPRGGAAVGGMLDEASAHCVTVPGAAACWADAVEKFGRAPLADVLAPAIELAEAGAPIHGVAASLWRENAHQLTDRWGGLGGNPGAASLLVDGRPPERGQVLRNPELARTFRALAAEGRDGFYRGRVAEAVVAAVRGKGGLLALEDLAAHETEACEPASANYRRKTVWELPPNGSGAVALLALDILEGFGPGTPDEDAHRTIEALRLAFSDGLDTIGDGADGAVAKLLDPARVAGHRALLREGRALGGANGPHAAAALDALGTDTVFLTAVDGDGNACAFICSNYCAFGSGLEQRPAAVGIFERFRPENDETSLPTLLVFFFVGLAPLGCGFTLHNRGYNFVLEDGHANCLAPRKRPYHTIIPAIVTDEDGDFFASFGVMGGFMQPPASCGRDDFREISGGKTMRNRHRHAW